MTILNANSKIFMIYVVIQKQDKITIYFSKEAQIKTKNKNQFEI